ncbi:MAG TPA: nicotinate-nucleotide--dimethylbenzimidazole phosphoribosyltransferase [Candidatus Avacidaminococcus intestinavium]|uniref:Nicotinate-nucleotide--dimethylbenzimidazole phosphoribosyltransferase n=1 Tax=Candidatus Avacidaminococcus intestinavium TaxID=2840684 RepID=A0A9D1SLU5_9FIRM|nr:nicotinate-nucleotide--dimethylbenzimidazole phosphoribosyltransferase [Candidatus Avacidaminococcus intestinavium]
MVDLTTIINELETVDQRIIDLAQRYFDDLIKPVGSLAKLESMATRYIAITGELEPEVLNYPKKAIMLWTIPSDQTFVNNLDSGKEALTYLAQEAKAEVIINELKVLDTEKERIKILTDALLQGYELTQSCLIQDNYDMIAVGLPGAYTLPQDWESIQNTNAHEILEACNDIRLAAIVGSIICAAKNKKVVMLDGLASVLGAFIAAKLAPKVTMYCLAGCVTTERGQEELLKTIGLSPILRLEITQGQGEGSTMAFRLFDAGIRAYKEMATFSGGGVHAELEEFSLTQQKANTGV